jgi:hypothetical protein
MNQKDIHTEHCCIKHGCKYGDSDHECTVTSGRGKQSKPCMVCIDLEEEQENRKNIMLGFPELAAQVEMYALVAEMNATMAFLEGMKVANQERMQNGLAMAYGEEAFVEEATNLQEISQKMRELNTK